MSVKETVDRIYAEGKGNEVKKTLKVTFARNLEMAKVLEIFESLAFQFMLDDYGKQSSGSVKKILEEAIRRRNHLFLHLESEERGTEYFEVVFVPKNEHEPFIFINNENRSEETHYSKKAFIEKIMTIEPYIVEVI
ncbi:hypothetical protein ACH0BF_19475 [Pseudobacillus sp. 179-B 2D1 NHS]